MRLTKKQLMNKSRKPPIMNEEQIADIWVLFREYVDKKQIDLVAEKFIDLLADYGVDDPVFKDCLGIDSTLDSAITYYLDLDNIDNDYDDEEDY
jgi:hypothetical protein